MIGRHWSDEIADVTERPEFQTAQVVITPPGVGRGEYNVDTGEYENPDPPAPVYTGRARVISIRWGDDKLNDTLKNPSTLSSVRVQIPQSYVGRVRRGSKVEVLSAPLNPALVGAVLVVTSDLQGSSGASRSFECEMDGDAYAR